MVKSKGNKITKGTRAKGETMYKAKKIKFLFDDKKIQITYLQMGMITCQTTKPLTIDSMKEAHKLLDEKEIVEAGIDYFVVKVA